jgi:hypothetical protein
VDEQILGDEEAAALDEGEAIGDETIAIGEDMSGRVMPMLRRMEQNTLIHHPA